MLDNDADWGGRLKDRTGDIARKINGDPREQCWTKGGADVTATLRKRYKLYKSSIHITETTHFRHNGYCTNMKCTNPFHYSVRT